jgi:hypothetical protein
MNGLSKLGEKIRGIAIAIKQTSEQRAVAVSGDVLAAVQNRILNTGKKSDGSKFPKYSKTQLPKFWFFDRSLNNGSGNRVKRLKKKTISYAEFRKLNNLRTDITDLRFTGEMWKGVKVVVDSRSFGRVSVSLKGTTKPSAQKVEWNSLRYGGSILTPSKDELRLARKVYTISVTSLFKSIFQ